MLGYDLNVIERGVRGLFAREFITRQRKAKYPAFTSVVNSDKKEEKYNMISTLPQLQEMTDERVLAGFKDYSYTVENKVYATGIKVPRQLFEFDQTGQIRTLVQSLGSRVANFPDKLVMELLGTNGTCYDSENYFDTDHEPIDGTNQTNIVTGAATDTLLDACNTETELKTLISTLIIDFQKAKSALLELLDDRGEPWFDECEAEGLVVLCHPRMEYFLRMALQAGMLLDSTNVAVKAVGKIMTTNRPNVFTNKSEWFLLKVDTPVKPLIFQRFSPKKDFPDSIPEEDQAVLQALNSVEVQSVMRNGKDIDAHTFFDDEYLFGARVVYSAGYGMWQNAIKVTGGA